MVAAAADTEVRLTALSHGGGCGCKIAPAVLHEALSGLSTGFAHPNLIVGNASSDDAAVFQLNDTQALVATTDFFMPIVDDAFEFGRIAATNALSDVYAMGANPILALAIVGMPVNKLPVTVMRRIMEGGAAVCHAAGVPLAGGHSIDAPEPIYGLAAMGVVHPARVKRNDTAQAGNVLILGKGLGVGILSAALKNRVLSDAGYETLLATTTQLNRVGRHLGELDGVHAMTDVTGFGLLGHLLEICRGSKLTAQVNFASVPLLETVRSLLEQGVGPGAIERNWKSYGEEVEMAEELPAWAWRVLCDPQTSGGLLVACAEREVQAVLRLFREEGFMQAAVIGQLLPGQARVSVR